MGYRVIKQFQDNKHDGHIYNAGDKYPAKGKKVTKARVEELSTEKNKYKTKYIEEIDTPKEKE